jgi:hypothetical protein
MGKKKKEKQRKRGWHMGGYIMVFTNRITDEMIPSVIPSVILLVTVSRHYMTISV